MSESLDEQLAEIASAARSAAESAADAQQLGQVRAEFLGRKGRLSRILRSISQVPAEQRAAVGQKTNRAKRDLTDLFDRRRAELDSAAADRERAGAARYDPTLPGTVGLLGSVHPVTAVQWEVEDAFARLGFAVAGGPEAEKEYYNFDALNIPADHPARDAQDTFWLTSGWLLRTHTSPCQVRAMERYGPPLRVIAPGRCFRYETIDASHENTFHQIEGLMIDRTISIANLIAVMKLLLREVFQRDVEIRLRPGYFPFVEPGFELDMRCTICAGAGCATCKRSGWVEVMPCGMVHPNVLRFGGIDPHAYTGFAFGLGLTRLAMMKYGISDIRVMNSGDLRALVQPDRLTGPTLIDKET